jgi:hypothetical protein
MKTVIEMAREAGLVGGPVYARGLDRFAALVRADERNRTWTQEHWTEYERSIAATVREECAALADKLEWADHKGVASAIRARGTHDL